MASTLWAAPGAVRALHGSGTVELALPPGGYVRLGDSYVLVATPRAPRGPLTLLVSGLERQPLAPGDHAFVDHALHIGPHTIPLIAAAPPPPPEPFRPGWRTALAAALQAVPSPPRDFTPGLAALQAGDTESAIPLLAGRGEGLTPAGDDVLAGHAYLRGQTLYVRSTAPSHFRPRPKPKGSDPLSCVYVSALAVGRASPIGLAYIRCAERGEVPEVVGRVVDAVRAGDVVAARLRARAVSRWGSSSGAAMLWGVASAT
jgi:uncharacterized protein DUF2877